MYVRGFGGRRFLLAVFQTRLLSLISFHPCHLFDVLKWSVCTHMWNYLQVTPLPSWLQSEASNVHLWEEAEGGGEFPCPGSHLEFALFDRSLIALFVKKLSFFFFFSFLFNFSWTNGRRKGLTMNKDCLPLLHGENFAFLSFCVGSQELQPTIKPAPCVTPSQS